MRLNLRDEIKTIRWYQVPTTFSYNLHRSDFGFCICYSLSSTSSSLRFASNYLNWWTWIFYNQKDVLKQLKNYNLETYACHLERCSPDAIFLPPSSTTPTILYVVEIYLKLQFLIDLKIIGTGCNEMAIVEFYNDKFFYDITQETFSDR